MTEATRQLEVMLRREAAGFAYPPTPDLASTLARSPGRRTVPRRALAWVALTLIVALAALLAVPSARARLAEFLRIGSLQIAPTQSLEEALIPTDEIPQSLLDMDGEVTLEQARLAFDFPLDLPAYPLDLGSPDRVYLQNLGTGEFVILVWLADGEVDLALYIIGPDVLLTKLAPSPIQVVTVNGRPGALVTGERLLLSSGGDASPRIFVDAPALVWEGEAGVTYRLESDRPLDELLRIAESIP
jgi:hypothetical protein